MMLFDPDGCFHHQQGEFVKGPSRTKGRQYGIIISMCVWETLSQHRPPNQNESYHNRETNKPNCEGKLRKGSMRIHLVALGTQPVEVNPLSQCWHESLLFPGRRLQCPIFLYKSPTTMDLMLIRCGCLIVPSKEMKSRFRSFWAHNVSSIRNYIWSMDRGICNWERSANEAAALVDFSVMFPGIHFPV